MVRARLAGSAASGGFGRPWATSQNAAAARADLAQDHEGGGAVAEALVDVRAAGFLAHRDQAVLAQLALELAARRCRPGCARGSSSACAASAPARSAPGCARSCPRPAASRPPAAARAPRGDGSCWRIRTWVGAQAGQDGGWRSSAGGRSGANSGRRPSWRGQLRDQHRLDLGERGGTAAF